MNKTPWFPGSVKPVRVGVYERDYGSATQCCKWNGSYWCAGEFTPREARIVRFMSDEQTLPWRGLAQDPKGKQ